MNSQQLPPLPSGSLGGRIKHSLRSLLPARGRQSVDGSGEWVMKRIQATRDWMDEERELLEEAWPRLGFRYKEDLIASMEICMLWGLFDEANKLRPSMQMTSEEQTMLHLMFFLMLYRDHGHPRAVKEAHSIKALLDQGEQLTTAMVNVGRRAASAHEAGQLLGAVIALHDAGVSPVAYAIGPTS